MTWNIENIDGKIEDPQIVSFLTMFDIVCICEAWIGEHTPSISLPGYDTFYQLREQNDYGRPHGGLYMFIKHSLPGRFTQLKSASENILWILYENATFGNLLISSVYHAPENSTHGKEKLLDTLTDELHAFLITHKTKYTLVLGDFNARTACELDYPLIANSTGVNIGEEELIEPPRRSNQDASLNTRGRDLLTFCKNTGLFILNGRFGKDNGIGRVTCYKYNGTSTVDYVLANEGLLRIIQEFEVVPRVEADHLPICFNWSIPPSSRKNETSIDRTEPYKKLKWRSDGVPDFMERLNSDEFNALIDRANELLTNNQQDNALNCLYDAIWLAAENMISHPRQNAKPRTHPGKQPWFDQECSVKKSEAARLLNLFRRRRDRTILTDYWEARSNYLDCKNEKKQNHARLRRNELVDAANSNSTNFWKILKSDTQLNDFAKLIDANTWLEYFRDLYKRVSDTQEVLYTEGPARDTSLIDANFTEEEVRKVIMQAKSGKSCGKDGIPNEAWKYSINKICPFITNLFNAIYAGGSYPDIWRVGIIVPLHKKGNVMDMNNYRGITLLSCLGKCFSALITGRLTRWTEQKNILVKTQSAFRRGFSTSDNIFILQTITQKYVHSNNGSLFAVFVDFRKAFDFVNREKLWSKLQKLGISHKMLSLLKEVYSLVQCCVKTGSHNVTELFESEEGLRQGENTSSIAFILYLNDLADYLVENGAEEISIAGLYLTNLLFADDLCILDKSARGLQRKINLLAQYCQLWDFQVNITKSKVMVFRKSVNQNINYNWTINGKALEVVNEYKYLGLQVHCTGKWTVAKNDLANRASRAVFSIAQNLKRFGNVTTEIQLKLFDCKVLPILIYGSEVWGVSGIDSAEIIASNFYRRLLGLLNNASVAFARGELGRNSLTPTILSKIISYWIKIVNSPHDKAIFQCYQYQYHLCENRNVDCWATSVKQVLFLFGFGYAWTEHSVGDMDCFLNEFKTRSKDIDTQNWHGMLMEYGNLRTYRTIKQDLQLEPYLKLNLHKNILNRLARLRGGLLRIGVNTGRWENVPYLNRLCKFCNSNVIDDENHFIFHCTATSTFRHNLMQYQIFHEHNLKRLFKVVKRDLSKDLSLYIETSLNYRQEIIDVLG